MKKGGKRVLVIGSSKGYGEKGAGRIPPNSHLVFQVEKKNKRLKRPFLNSPFFLHRLK